MEYLKNTKRNNMLVTLNNKMKKLFKIYNKS